MHMDCVRADSSGHVLNAPQGKGEVAATSLSAAPLPVARQPDDAKKRTHGRTSTVYGIAARAVNVGPGFTAAGASAEALALIGIAAEALFTAAWLCTGGCVTQTVHEDSKLRSSLQYIFRQWAWAHTTTRPSRPCACRLQTPAGVVRHASTAWIATRCTVSYPSMDMCSSELHADRICCVKKVRLMQRLVYMWHMHKVGVST